MAAMGSTIALTIDGPVARVRLNRPDQLNAISPGLLDDLDAACAAIEDAPRVKVADRLIGERRAKELMFLGGWLSADQALAWGLVNRVAPAGAVADVVDEIARTIATGSGSAARTVKAMIGRGRDMDLPSGLAMERALVARHMRSADAAEGLRAFAEKRRPAFD
ncbi:MAG: hypothetical protein HY216_05910 [Candidatus Rokubacteria bacterium]|nr:hypothetical protein [Candidatus Rokubacteria bacterium]